MLLDYLYGFLHRVKPLLDLNVELNIITADFEEKFEKGEFYGLPRETGGSLNHTGAHLDLSAFLCPEELASLGLDRLKFSLMALGLKCGGTLDERAVRLLSTKGKCLYDLNPNLFDKTKPGKGGKKDTEELKEVASMEAQVYRFVEMSDEEEEEEPDDDIPYNPYELAPGLGRQAHPVLAVQVARSQLDLRQLPVQGPQSLPEALRRVEARARHEMPGHPQQCALRQCHAD